MLQRFLRNITKTQKTKSMYLFGGLQYWGCDYAMDKVIYTISNQCNIYVIET